MRLMTSISMGKIRHWVKHGMEWNGLEWNGLEWNGMEWNGLDWNGMEFYSIISS